MIVPDEHLKEDCDRHNLGQGPRWTGWKSWRLTVLFPMTLKDKRNKYLSTESIKINRFDSKMIVSALDIVVPTGMP